MTDHHVVDPPIEGMRPPAPAPRRRRRGLIAVIAGIAAAVVLGGAAAAVLVMREHDQAPVRATERFLTALADGDLDIVRDYLPGDFDRSLITEEVLSASLEAAPIDDIEVTGGREGVEATFTIGGEETSRSFDVDEVEGDWVVWDAATPLPSLADYTDVGARLNGVEIPADVELAVLPGRYMLSLDSAYFALEGETTHTVVSGRDADDVRDATVVLSPDGAAAFTRMVAESLQECLAMTSATSSCGIDIDLSQVKGTFNEGSAVRTLTAEDQAILGDIPHILLRGERTTARVAMPLTVDVDFTSDEPDGTWEYDWDGYRLWPQIDFSVEPLEVSWTG
jgi:hypothetical protein